MFAGAGPLVKNREGRYTMVKRFTINVPEGCRQVEIAFDDLVDAPRAAPRRAPPRPTSEDAFGAGGMSHPFGYDNED
jgi:hypothetical protein